ncbi:hypothetical protein IE53DRAFT_102440 [Violaceomyces palustris]|uniref:Uncharacterized protein n=1 Tax=Violaceomyces palustris TaxID=1673888 RepID=A0ACD0NWV2_9BASI|nr:hypothetical protein IE53DRAFT_102440 [Violaceomyces palustris]
MHQSAREAFGVSVRKQGPVPSDSSCNVLPSLGHMSIKLKQSSLHSCSSFPSWLRSSKSSISSSWSTSPDTAVLPCRLSSSPNNVKGDTIQSRTSRSRASFSPLSPTLAPGASVILRDLAPGRRLASQPRYKFVNSSSLYPSTRTGVGDCRLGWPMFSRWPRLESAVLLPA